MTTAQESIQEVKTKLTLTEVGVIFSIASSLAVGIFTLGIYFGQVSDNTREIGELKRQNTETIDRLARIETKVDIILETK